MFWEVIMEVIQENKMRKSNGFRFLCVSVWVWLFQFLHFCIYQKLVLSHNRFGNEIQPLLSRFDFRPSVLR